jgi:hypothetical protein
VSLPSYIIPIKDEKDVSDVKFDVVSAVNTEIAVSWHVDTVKVP